MPLRALDAPKMHDVVPQELRDAREQLLEADADSERAATSRSSLERLGALRAARAVIAQWRRGDIDLADAVARIEALVAQSRR